MFQPNYDKRRYRSVIELQCVSEVVSVIDSEMYILPLKIVFKSWPKNLKSLHFSFVVHIQGSFYISLGTARSVFL
jgi:hypothetical protein